MDGMRDWRGYGVRGNIIPAKKNIEFFMNQRVALDDGEGSG